MNCTAIRASQPVQSTHVTSLRGFVSGAILSRKDALKNFEKQIEDLGVSTPELIFFFAGDLAGAEALERCARDRRYQKLQKAFDALYEENAEKKVTEEMVELEEKMAAILARHFHNALKEWGKDDLSAVYRHSPCFAVRLLWQGRQEYLNL